MINDVLLTPLKIISVEGGDVLHGMKAADAGACGFGEVYFSTVDRGAVKAWKRHRAMTLNIVVPVGEILFVIYDDRSSVRTAGAFQEIILSKHKYARLTVPPMVWMGFQGLGTPLNLLMNVANIPHDPAEIDRLAADAFEYDWKKLL
jgi:dTDP-4-dehydrorhamnose 3,5-epimerase